MTPNETEQIRQYLLTQLHEQEDNPVINKYLMGKLHSLELTTMIRRVEQRRGTYKKYGYTIDFGD